MGARRWGSAGCHAGIYVRRIGDQFESERRARTSHDRLGAALRTRYLFAGADLRFPGFQSPGVPAVCPEAMLPDSPSRVSEILRRFDPADETQAEELMGLVYGELRALAARQLRHEGPNPLLQPTALVHEAWIRLVRDAPGEMEGRAHFFGVAARAMRQVLVDFARRRDAARRGGDLRKVTLDPDLVADRAVECEFLELHDALERLGRLDAALERLIELRFFTGLTLDEAAAALGVSRRKAAKDWAAARLWLRRELAEA